jgi:hypothetical protein
MTVYDVPESPVQVCCSISRIGEVGDDSRSLSPQVAGRCAKPGADLDLEICELTESGQAG